MSAYIGAPHPATTTQVMLTYHCGIPGAGEEMHNEYFEDYKTALERYSEIMTKADVFCAAIYSYQDMKQLSKVTKGWAVTTAPFGWGYM